MAGAGRRAAAPDEPLRGFLAHCVSAGRMPGAAWWVGVPGRPASHGALGRRAVGGDPVRADTPFDLASLTKPLVTATLVVLLEQEGRIDLAAPLGDVLREAGATPYASRSLLSLATHTAGVEPWAPLYLAASGTEEYVAAILGRPPAVAEGRTLYSDLGYILLGAVLERSTGRRLDELFRERIVGPLGLRRTGFACGGRIFADAAATERGNRYERALAGNAGAGHAWRREIPAGEVHDANAHALGGRGGHAGLFGTAEEVAQVACEWLRPGPLALGGAARERLLRAAPAADGRTVGLVLAARSRAGRGILPDVAAGHTGFTGTSLWVDPSSNRCYVLLTNRVHPGVPPADFQWVRRAFHRLARRLAAGA
jgi:CubicO group peptidase (beta-lactamase class C family)